MLLKAILKIFISCILVQLLMHRSVANAQTIPMANQWTIGLNAGFVSFFGDLSIHDFNPERKLTRESDFGYGITIEKGINRTLSLYLSGISGKMRGSNPGQDMKFNNRFSEFGMGSQISVSQLFWPGTPSRFNFLITTGLGIIANRTVVYRISNGEFVLAVGYTSEQEKSGKANNAVVFPIGMALNMSITRQITARVETALRLISNDLLDAQIGSTGINDRYSYAAISLLYTIKPAKSSDSGVYGCPANHTIMRSPKKRR